VTEPGASASRLFLRTLWAPRLETPLRRFLHTETGSAAVLLAATLAALAWANIDPAGYAATWHTELVVRSGGLGLADSWQGWVNSGLMAFSFWWPAWRRAASSTWGSCGSGGGWRCRW
jgi:Na+/H+ antiporter 1